MLQTIYVLNKKILQYRLLSFQVGKKWVLTCQNFGERTAKVKLELTDFNSQNSIIFFGYVDF